MASSILTSFLGALQASLAVLLTISYGILASRLNILKAASARDVSKVCVRLFLPALLITNVGEQLHLDTASRYVPVLIWALVYTLLSMGLGWALHRAFPPNSNWHFPAWTVPAICFNNTTALPLLLLQSLETAGILSDLTMSHDDSSSDVLKRAKSYFLVSAMVGNSLTFAIGPKLLDDEEVSNDHYAESQRIKGQQTEEEPANGRGDEEDGRRSTHDINEEHEDSTNSNGSTAAEEEDYANETTSLLPEPIVDLKNQAVAKLSSRGWKCWSKVPQSIRTVLVFAASLLNAPLIGAVIGGTVGLVPSLHKVFFNEPNKGGIFKAWLTESVSNIGGLFASLQLVVVGAKLSGSLLKMKQGEQSGHVPLIPMFAIFFIRFVLWPVISISTIYLIASRTAWLSPDPVLWFVLMLMPTGPPATKLVSMADLSGVSEEEKMSIAKLLTICYAVSPLICLAVVASLKTTLLVKDG